MSRDEVYLRHILDAILSIEQYIEPGREAFLTEPMRRDAVIRQLEIVGEAAKQLSPELRRGEPEIPWRQVASLRDRLIHGYSSVDLVIVWEVANREMPLLKRVVTRRLTKA